MESAMTDTNSGDWKPPIPESYVIRDQLPGSMAGMSVSSRPFRVGQPSLPIEGVPSVSFLGLLRCRTAADASRR